MTRARCSNGGPASADGVRARLVRNRHSRAVNALRTQARPGHDVCTTRAPPLRLRPVRPRHLRDELKRPPSGRPQVGFDATPCRHRSLHERDVRKIKPPSMIIWVPSRICTWPWRNDSSALSWLPGFRIESLSMRTHAYFANRARTLLFESLRSYSQILDSGISAHGAGRRRGAS